MRQDRGPFAEPGDLLSVPGLGPATLARITPHFQWATEPRPESAARPPRPDLDREAGKPGRVDLNRASSEELQRLPGVGPVMAERILTLRQDLGRFLGLEELKSVRGIGPATIERIRALVIVGR
jgi:competence ComEA-like helix-hairpin-helix protein